MKLSIKNGARISPSVVPGTFLAVFFLAIWWLSGPTEAFSTGLAFLLYSALFFLLRIAYGIVFRKGVPTYRDFFASFVRASGRGLALITVFLAAFAVYHNEANPAEMPAYVLSNGEKTVVFRPMAHIASERYYAAVKAELAAARKEGFVLFYEGVRPGTAENADRFNELLGIKFSKELYPAMSKLYGLVPQNTADIVGEFGPNDKNSDVSIDDIVAAYDAKFGTGSKPSSVVAWGTQDVAAEFSKYAQSLNARELSLLRYVNRGVMSMVIKNHGAADAVAAGAGNAELFSIILHDRNAVIARDILASEEKKIYATYGLLHFDGVFDLLQEADSKWRVTISEARLHPTVP